MISLTYYYSGFSRAAYRCSKALQGISSCRVPIHYTWVKRDNCGQNTLSKGIRTEWDMNPRPSDYKLRAQTTTPQCSHTCSIAIAPVLHIELAHTPQQIFFFVHHNLHNELGHRMWHTDFCITPNNVKTYLHILNTRGLLELNLAILQI